MRAAKRNNFILWLLPLLFLAAVVAAWFSFGSYAKYIASAELSGKVTFQASLAEAFRLTEHNALRGADGSYTLGSAEVTNNTYMVMPGVDIPKDPALIVLNKTAVDAYLYAEVLETDLPATVTYSVADTWLPLSISGAHGGTLYVYKTVLTQDDTERTYPILADSLLTVSESFDPLGTSDFNLKFYGYMAEKTDDAVSVIAANAADAFTENF